MGVVYGFPMPTPVFVFQRGLIGVKGPVKHEIAQLALDDL